MRILIFTEYLPISDRGEITGGTEAYCHYVGKHLRAAGHDVRFITRSTDGSVWEHATVWSLPKRLWFLMRGLVGGLRADADVVVGTTIVVHPLAWLVGKVRRRPVVLWYADVLIGNWRSGHFGRVAGALGERAERAVLRLPVDGYIAISNTTADRLAHQGVARDRIAVIPCGFEPGVLAAVTPERAPGRRIASVGRLVGYKRHDVVIRALARLAPGSPDLTLVIVGQGPQRGPLQRLAIELGVADRVEFRGFVPRHADVLSMVAGCAAFVSASEIEGFGIALVEAMALGVPHVATDIPAFREVTAGGIGGALFAPGDDAQLAHQLALILSDTAVRDRLAAEAIEHARRYGWPDIAAATERHLADVVDASGPPSGPRARRGLRRP